MWRGEERTNRRYVRRRESFRAPGSIVLLREADRSLSLSHAALIAYRSPIYVEREGRSHGEAGEDASRRSSPRNAAGCCLDQRERERETRPRRIERARKITDRLRFLRPFYLRRLLSNVTSNLDTHTYIYVCVHYDIPS